MGRGRFITFEGGDGAGKTTQIAALKGRLVKSGLEVVLTREPGGSPGAEEIRNMLVTGDPKRWDAKSEALLFFAARRNHVETMIKPNIEQGKWVLCDRFSDSTMAYQGYAQGLGKKAIEELYTFTLGAFEPNLTLILDIDPEEGLRRSGARNHSEGSSEDRFEKMGKEFHVRLRDAFLDIAADHPKRCVVIDAGHSEEKVEKQVWAAVKERFGL